MIGRKKLMASYLDEVVEPGPVLVPKGQVAYEHDVEDDPAGPHVHCLAIRLTFQNLGCDVAGCA